MRPIRQILKAVHDHNVGLAPDVKGIRITHSDAKKGAHRIGAAQEKRYLAASRAKVRACGIMRRNLKAEGKTPLEVQQALIDAGLIPDIRLVR